MENIVDMVGHKTKWCLKKFSSQADFARDDAYDEIDIDGNLLLNEGITVLQNLLTGAADTAYDNANAHIGVGDSATAAAPGQTGLQAAVNKTYKPMEATYPVIAGQATTFRAVFAANDANHAWNEMSVANGVDDTASNLNRKVSAQGTKTVGQVWTLDLTITWS